MCGTGGRRLRSGGSPSGRPVGVLAEGAHLMGAPPEDSPLFVSLTHSIVCMEMGYLMVHNATQTEGGACKDRERRETQERSRCEQAAVQFC